MKKVMLTLLIVCMVLSIASLPVYATPPTEVSGVIDYYVDFDNTVILTRGRNTFFYGTDEEYWQADPEGGLDGYVAETDFVVIEHASGAATFQSQFVFEGTVLGSETGTMEMILIGQIPPGGEWWYGTWVILGGSDGLANVHGQGVWYGPGMNFDPEVPDLWYEGQVHFDP
jgi:hypothetical protein